VKQLQALRQGFVAFGDSLEAFFEGHGYLLSEFSLKSDAVSAPHGGWSFAGPARRFQAPHFAVRPVHTCGPWHSLLISAKIR
jgi:hypothetical protein